MGDLREELEQAFAGEDIEETIVEDVVEDSEEDTKEDDRARDASGKFVKAEEPIVESPDIEEVEDPIEVDSEIKEPVVEPALAPPNGWSADAKAKWHELPADIQQAVNQRELDAHKRISKHDEDGNFGREMNRAIQPYMAQINADGGNPSSVVQNLLNTAYVLRTGSEEQKTQALMQVASEFGITLGEQQEGNEFTALNQRINQLEGQLTSRELNEQNQIKTEVQSEVDTFATNPENTHYQEVKANMAALLSSGAAKDLKDAYDKACWSSPEVRATLLAQQRVEEEQKRKADAKAQVDKAKQAGISINGGPGTSSGPAPEDRNLREELEANFSAQSSVV